MAKWLECWTCKLMAWNQSLQLQLEHTGFIIIIIIIFSSIIIIFLFQLLLFFYYHYYLNHQKSRDAHVSKFKVITAVCRST